MKDVVSATEGLFALSKVRPFSFSPSCTTYPLASCCPISAVLPLLATPSPRTLSCVHIFRLRFFSTTCRRLPSSSETFVQRQEIALAAEVKAVLDSWFRFDQQAKESEQAKLVKPVIDSVLKNFSNDEMQKDILASTIAEIERTSFAPSLTPLPPLSSVVSFRPQLSTSALYVLPCFVSGYSV